MNPNRTVIIVCILGCAGANYARAAEPAPKPPAAATPPAAASPSTPPTAEEMAPLKIPSNPTKETDFPSRLDKACTPLVPLALAASSDLSKLQGACAAIKAGRKLSDDDLAALRAFFNDPPKFEALIAAAQKAAPQVTQQGVVIPSPGPSSGSLESDIIQGLAQFVYDRSKAEATIYFTKQLRKKLCEGDHALFFPSICVALAETSPSIPLGAMGTYLAAAARTDLGQLPDRTLAYTLHELPSDKVAEREPLFGGRIVLAYYQTVRSGRTPLDVARSLHGIQVSDKIVGHDTTVLRTTKVLSEILDAVQAQKGWTGITLPAGSAPSPIITCYALGAFFTFEKAYSADGMPFGPIATDKIAEVIPLIAGYLVDAAALANRSKQAKSAALAALAAPSSVGSFGTAALPQGTASGSSGLTARDYAIAATQTLGQTLDAGLQILGGLGIQVSAAVKTTINDVGVVQQIGEQLLNGQSPGDLVILAMRVFHQLTAAVAGAAPPRALADIQQLLALIAQIADAKSADEVANVITAAAAPTSTYELKYQNNMVAIGAMAGVSAGYEALRTNGLGWSSGGVVGAFAPFGLTASTPVGSCSHVGVMVSVINLGALVSARFSQDVKTTTTPTAGTTTTTVETAPQVKLANVLAPGVFFALGLGKSPFVLSLGGQVVPIGREVSTVAADGTTSTTTMPAIQLLGALAVDVPIFPF